MSKVYINDIGILCALGNGLDAVRDNLLDIAESPLVKLPAFISGKDVCVGKIMDDLPELDEDTPRIYKSRNNRVLLAAYNQIRSAVETAVERYGAGRIGIVLGSSTSGIDSGEKALEYFQQNGDFPEEYHYVQQEMSSPSEYLQSITKTTGPCYTISTACSSGSKAIASAKRLIEADVCDAVIAGGVDTLCKLTLNGFNALEAIGDELCNPFSKNRKGINIGEGAGLFLISTDIGEIEIAGIGESSDAYHFSAPDPTGKGAKKAMQDALDQANIQPEQISYINLHGTATKHNDDMEGKAVFEVFGDSVPGSSTKPFTGHALGAAGAIELGICSLLLNYNERNKLPTHLYDGDYDDAIPGINLVDKDNYPESDPVYALSNSFAFGGSNIAVVIKKVQDNK
ncbi:MAG: beta-ketoacyl-[acyl-carrier-protein] synthase family protein [Gammaproteobacteria bacterium]|nr:MAG: beta-ketoacyl-[acyl-carrier-protein] synthase family protein [Gammaproteobacteria bacterium]